MNRAFRRYHRQIAIAACVPLFLTVLSGFGFTIAHEWFHQDELAEFLLKIHTLEIIKLEAIYPIVNGLALVGLLVTGLTMTGLFRPTREPNDTGDR